MRLRGDFAELAAFDLQRGAMRVVAAARGQREAADRSDRRQGLAAETERGHRFQVVERGDLAGRVARHRQRQFVGRDAAAVVADADQAHAAFLQVDVDAARAGVERVLDQFLDHGRRAFDDLAGGDLVDEGVGKLADAARLAGASPNARRQDQSAVMIAAQGLPPPAAVACRSRTAALARHRARAAIQRAGRRLAQ